MIEQALAFLRGGLRRIADGAASVQVLGLPGERRRPVRGEPAVVLFHRDPGGTKIRDRLMPYVLLESRQHDRGLGGAAMNAVLQFRRGKQSLRRTEAGPAGGDDEKAVLRPQILRDKAHGRAVAAMARDQDQLLDAGTRD